MTGELSLEARLDIAEVLTRYATGIDTRDWDLFMTCFSDDCNVDYGAIGHWHGPKEISEFMREVHAPCGHTLHRVTNASICGTKRGATARSYVDALVMLTDNQSGTRATGYYDDELVEASRGWQISSRRFTTVLIQAVPDGTIFNLD
jgi:3-phenylpropionate/cinnamic acid dioxygenase small subunit